MMPPSSIQARVSLLLLSFGLGVLFLNAWHNLHWSRERQMTAIRDEAEAQGTMIAGIMQHCFRNKLRRAAELQMSYTAIIPSLEFAVVVDDRDVIRYSTRLDWVGLALAESPAGHLASLAAKARATRTGEVITMQATGEVLAAHPFLTQYNSMSHGVALHRFDTEATMRAARAEALRISAVQAGMLLALCAVIWVVLDVIITDRVQKVLAQAHEAASGGSMPVPLSGKDELAQISQAFAGAVALVRQTEARILEATEHERRRIGHDLHDDVCQRIAATQLLTGALSRALQEEGSTQVEVAEMLAAEQNETAEVVRRVAKGLAPVRVDLEGLAPALVDLAGQVTKAFGIPCEVDCAMGERPLAMWVQTHVFRIVQELMINAAKHAHPTWINAAVRVSDGLLRIQVENDGLAFMPPKSSESGMGMQFLRQRARALGGRLAIRPGNEGKGTLALCEAHLSAIHFSEANHETT